MDRIPKERFTVAEYFALESVSDQRHQYDRGVFYVFEDDPADHNTVQANLAQALRDALRNRSCLVLSGRRLYAPASELFTYTDLAVICSHPVLFEGRHDTLVNPEFLVEVVWALSREYDAGEKFERFKDIESLQEYVLVESEKAHVECFRRRDGEWTVSMFDGLDATCQFESVDCEIPLSRIYQKVTWLD